ncbi:unnamed protein product [Meganyctiphanes norvegica]|uniref:Uncharacterized protein n=1 Tax=Meganyctiphanes norvegica TaxID=48144 RepID=A0AAV2S2A9_MEGNR
MDLRGKLNKKNRFAGRIVDLRRKCRNFRSPPKILFKQLQDLEVFKDTRICPSPYHPHPLTTNPEELNKLDMSSEEEMKDDKVLYNLDEKIVVPHHLYNKRRRRKYVDLDKPSEYYTFSIDDSGNFTMEKGTIDNPFANVDTNDMPNFGNKGEEEFFKFLQETSDILQDNRYMFTGTYKNRYIQNFTNIEQSSEYIPQGETYENEYTLQGMNIIPSVSGQTLPRDLNTPPRNSNVVGDDDASWVEQAENLADFTNMPVSPSGYDKCFEDMWNTTAL